MVQKTRSSKTRKIAIFPKGLVHGFLSKIGHFCTVCFVNIGQQKTFYDILERKTHFQAVKTSLKSRNIDIFPKGLVHGFGPKLAILFQNEKTPFQAIKKKFKSRKIDIFLKGLVHGFGPKLAILPPFLSQAIQARKVCFMIFQNEKTASKAIKTKS